jgi:hypothetical protein
MQNDINGKDDCSRSSLLPPPLSSTECQSPPSHLTQQQPELSDGVPTGPRSLDDDIVLGLNSPIDELKKTAEFICGLRGATLEHSNFIKSL